MAESTVIAVEESANAKPMIECKKGCEWKLVEELKRRKTYAKKVDLPTPASPTSNIDTTAGSPFFNSAMAIHSSLKTLTSLRYCKADVVVVRFAPLSITQSESRLR